RVVMESFYTIGLTSMTGGKPAFINFTSTILLENIAILFPKEQLVIELLEDIEPTAEIVNACRDLCHNGYTLALDDFVYRRELEPLIQLCKIIKFDFLAMPLPQVSDTLKQINIAGKLLLAEKIESVEMFQKAADMGFKLFQGYFFCKPVTLASKSITPLKAHYALLLREANEGPYMNFRKLANIILGDVALSYKLLRMVNSAYYALPTEVVDIMYALTILGTEDIRKWIFLMAIMDMCSDKPDELIRMSMIRGRFMEQIKQYCRLPYSSESIFLTGLFSLLDVMMEQPMHTALNNMPLASEVLKTLVEHEGPLFDLLRLVISLEQGAWDEADKLSSLFSLSSKQVANEYLEAVKWCNEINF
ncbi:MAG: HDOD domain-containing protein, partial [Clostridiales bacterium]|nr:HDOD domain-containing protein [Clostridiales bacterium]